MVEGVTTRYKALEDAIASVAQEVKDHSERFTLQLTTNEHIQQTLHEFQQSFSDIQQSLNRLERHSFSSPNPPLLPTPSSIPHPPSISFMSTPQFVNLPQLAPPPSDAFHTPSVRLPKLEVPFFAGENVVGWLFQMEHFFLYHYTPVDQKLTIAAFYMAGPALQWFHWMHTTR